jgi:hypothetical protein
MTHCHTSWQRIFASQQASCFVSTERAAGYEASVRYSWSIAQSVPCCFE